MVFVCSPPVAWMKPGRIAYPRKGIASRAFSVSPFTLAHITRPCSVLSVPRPEMYSNTTEGDARAITSAAARVMSTVIRRYSGSFFPTDDTPRQNRHASAPTNSSVSTPKPKKSRCSTSRILECDRPTDVRPTTTTADTPGSVRHWASTAWPTIPVAPNTMTFTGASSRTTRPADPARYFAGFRSVWANVISHRPDAGTRSRTTRASRPVCWAVLSRALRRGDGGGGAQFRGRRCPRAGGRADLGRRAVAQDLATHEERCSGVLDAQALHRWRAAAGAGGPGRSGSGAHGRHRTDARKRRGAGPDRHHQNGSELLAGDRDRRNATVAAGSDERRHPCGGSEQRRPQRRAVGGWPVGVRIVIRCSAAVRQAALLDRTDGRAPRTDAPDLPAMSVPYPTNRPRTGNDNNARTTPTARRRDGMNRRKNASRRIQPAAPLIGTPQSSVADRPMPKPMA